MILKLEIHKIFPMPTPLSHTCTCEFMPACAGMKCHIMNKIGEGGFAAIYKAVAADSSEVAVKVRQAAAVCIV